jgi:hypothetical protein
MIAHTHGIKQEHHGRTRRLCTPHVRTNKRKTQNRARKAGSYVPSYRTNKSVNECHHIRWPQAPERRACDPPRRRVEKLTQKPWPGVRVTAAKLVLHLRHGAPCGCLHIAQWHGTPCSRTSQKARRETPSTPNPVCSDDPPSIPLSACDRGVTCAADDVARAATACSHSVGHPLAAKSRQTLHAERLWWLRNDAIVMNHRSLAWVEMEGHSSQVRQALAGRA